MSIRSRLATFYGVGVVVTLLVAGLLVWWQTGVALRASLEGTLATRLAGVATSLENAGQAGLQESDQRSPGVFVVLFTPAGALVDATSNAPHGIGPVAGVVAVGGRQYLVQKATAGDGTIVIAGADLQPVADTQAALARLLVVVGLVVGAASLFGGWWLAGRSLAPVDRLIDEASALGPGDLDRRLATPPRMDEVGRLTLTLNGMLDRLADSVERQRLFVAMASHELRTPLAALRAELDLVDRREASLADYRQALQDARGDVIRLASLATSLLELAESRDDSRSISRAPTRLRMVAASVVRDVEPLARGRGVEVAVDVPDAVVWVDRIRIEHAVGNLVTNAVVHAGDGGSVELRARVDRSSGRSLLTVEVLDRGPGIGDVSPDALFAPFRRGAHGARTGSGLGLATVASAVRAHGGSLGAANRDGRGARFWFTVPCEPDGAEPVARPGGPPADRS